MLTNGTYSGLYGSEVNNTENLLRTLNGCNEKTPRNNSTWVGEDEEEEAAAALAAAPVDTPERAGASKLGPVLAKGALGVTRTYFHS